MPLPKKNVIKAYANPYAHGYKSLDHEGRGHAHATRFGQGAHTVLGADVDVERTREEGQCVLNYHADPSHPAGRPPFTIVCSGPYWLKERQHCEDILNEGVWIPADAQTAALVNQVLMTPQEVADHIEACRQAAIADWKLHYGELPACAQEDHKHGGAPALTQEERDARKVARKALESAPGRAPMPITWVALKPGQKAPEAPMPGDVPHTTQTL